MRPRHVTSLLPSLALQTSYSRHYLKLNDIYIKTYMNGGRHGMVYVVYGSAESVCILLISHPIRNILSNVIYGFVIHIYFHEADVVK